LQKTILGLLCLFPFNPPKSPLTACGLYPPFFPLSLFLSLCLAIFLSCSRSLSAGYFRDPVHLCSCVCVCVSVSLSLCRRATPRRHAGTERDRDRERERERDHGITLSLHHGITVAQSTTHEPIPTLLPRLLYCIRA